MTNVQFDEQNTYTSRRIFGEAIVPGMAGSLIKAGIVKNGYQAKYILVGVIICSLLLTIIFLSMSFRNKAPTLGPLTPEEKAIVEQMTRPARTQ